MATLINRGAVRLLQHLLRRSRRIGSCAFLILVPPSVVAAQSLSSADSIALQRWLANRIALQSAWRTQHPDLARQVTTLRTKTRDLLDAFGDQGRSLPTTPVENPAIVWRVDGGPDGLWDA